MISEVNNVKILRLLAFLEGTSYIVLLGICMPLKYIYAMPMPTRIVGMAHGILFLAYCFWVLLVRSEKKWNNKTTFWALLASIIPFGTFVADAKIFRETGKK